MDMIARAVQAAGESGKEATQKAAKQQAAREVATRDNTPKVRATTGITPVNLESKPTINAAKLLDLVHGVYTYWARYDNPYDPVIATLWAASTWLTEPDGPMMFDAHPRLFMIAPPGSGKTRIMKITRALVKDPTPIGKSTTTAPGIKSALEAGKTVFLDELDRMIVRGYGHMDIQGLISAYERDTGSFNGRGGYNDANIFGPMMLGAKPRILTGTQGMIEDLFERSFILNPVKWTDPDHPIPDLGEEFDSITEPIPAVMQMWGQAVTFDVPGRTISPIHSVPRELTSRVRELALPLLAVADRAVDPGVMEREGKDLRWAIRGREAVQASLLGHGSNGNAMLADTIKRFKALGVKI